eukprot:9002967-Prorocentrum_lima.AAC.1
MSGHNLEDFHSSPIGANGDRLALAPALAQDTNLWAGRPWNFVKRNAYSRGSIVGCFPQKRN